MPSRRLSDCDPRLADLWMQVEYEYAQVAKDRTLLLTCTYRPPEEQLGYFLEGRARMDDGTYVVVDEDLIKTNCDGTMVKSRHNALPCTALDFAVLVHGKITWKDSEYAVVGEVAERLGLVWGGRWKRPHDSPHLELPNA